MSKGNTSNTYVSTNSMPMFSISSSAMFFRHLADNGVLWVSGGDNVSGEEAAFWSVSDNISQCAGQKSSLRE